MGVVHAAVACSSVMLLWVGHFGVSSVVGEVGTVSLAVIVGTSSGCISKSPSGSVAVVDVSLRFLLKYHMPSSYTLHFEGEIQIVKTHETHASNRPGNNRQIPRLESATVSSSV